MIDITAHLSAKRAFAWMAVLFTLASQAHAQTWSQVSQAMDDERFYHTAVYLPSRNQVLISGGQDNALNTLSLTELYDVAAQTFTVTDPMDSQRLGHSMTLVTGPDGPEVVAIGGRIRNGTIWNTAERYNLSSDTWVPITSTLSVQRAHPEVVVLNNGKLLLTGGIHVTGPDTSTSSVEIYDPMTRQFTQAASMNCSRSAHAAALLLDGRVLVAGGRGTCATPGIQKTAEIFDPSAGPSGSWTTISPMTDIREAFTMTVFPSGPLQGKALITGGAQENVINAVELFDPVSQTFSQALPMTDSRKHHRATLLPDGRVLIVGGTEPNRASAEIFDPSSTSWSTTASMQQARGVHTQTLLGNSVLVTGGARHAEAPNILNTAELFNLVVPTSTATSTPTNSPTATASPSSTPTQSPTTSFTASPTLTPTRTPEPICGNSSLEPGEACDDGNTDSGDCCSGDCTTITESVACGNCLDEADNNANGDTDADDSGCATLSESQHFGIVGRATIGKSAVLGGQFVLSAHDGSLPGSSAPFPLGPSRAGACGEARMELGSAVQVSGSLAVAANSVIKIGSGADTNIGYFFADAPTTTRTLTGMAPVVGPGTCTGDAAACTVDADCNPPASTCEGLLLTDAANPYVDHSGTHEELIRCTAAKAALLADTAYLYSLPGQLLPPISHQVGAPQPIPVLNGPGPHIFRVTQIRVAGTSELLLNADDPDAVVILQVEKGLSISKGANVRIAPGSPLKPENVLWVAQGKGSVKILGSSTFVGTVLGAERTIKIGQNVHIQGALLGNKVTIKGSSTLTHCPFTALF